MAQTVTMFGPFFVKLMMQRYLREQKLEFQVKLTKKLFPEAKYTEYEPETKKNEIMSWLAVDVTANPIYVSANSQQVVSDHVSPADIKIRHYLSKIVGD